MGKGGTRFVSDAISVRAPRQRSSFSARELRRDMETYCETGVHPDIEKAIEEHRERPAEKPLPLFDPDRPFVYFQFSISGEAIGQFSLNLFDNVQKVTVELFREHHPRGVEMLQNLCKRGSQASLENRCVHRLLTECAFFMGRSKCTREIIRRPRLNHTEKGTVSISGDGNEVAITLREDALALDETHHVVGRVHLGLDVLDRVNTVIAGPFDIPLDDIRITKCGMTDHLGRIDAAEISGDKNAVSAKSPDNDQQLKLEAQRAQDDLKSALEEGLTRKRRVNEARERSNNKKRVLDLDLSSSTSSDEDA